MGFLKKFQDAGKEATVKAFTLGEEADARRQSWNRRRTRPRRRANKSRSYERKPSA